MRYTRLTTPLWVGRTLDMAYDQNTLMWFVWDSQWWTKTSTLLSSHTSRISLVSTCYHHVVHAWGSKQRGVWVRKKVGAFSGWWDRMGCKDQNCLWLEIAKYLNEYRTKHKEPCKTLQFYSCLAFFFLLTTVTRKEGVCLCFWCGRTWWWRVFYMHKLRFRQVANWSR